MSVLPREFYQDTDVVKISRNLLGKYIFTNKAGEITGGIITETEAYGGIHDRACHAWGNRRTKRTEVMYAPGGLAYVYLCYGLHWLFNVVTNGPGVPDAILIRAIFPLEGRGIMNKRRGRDNTAIASGPGNLSRALGIDGSFNGADLTGPVIWIEDRGLRPEESLIVTLPRVGVAFAGPDAARPWRFLLTRI
jgi:DNA-3-methyladenine glycosylase